MASVQNTRMLRFLLVLATVILTIFIYASYSSNTSLSPPHIRSTSELTNPDSPSIIMPAAQPLHLQFKDFEKLNHINNSVSGSGFINGVNNGNSGNTLKTIKKLNVLKKTYHREPTIDVDALNDGVIGTNSIDDNTVADEAALERFVNNDLLDEQYVQTLDNTLNATNIAKNSQQTPIKNEQQHQQKLSLEKKKAQQQQKQQQFDSNLNKIPDSDVLIPTSNLQKFIENADKILKNITVPSPAATPSAPPVVNKSIEVVGSIKDNNVQKNVNGADDEINTINKDYPDVALPPSVVMTIKRGGPPSAPQAVVTAQVNPGIQIPKLVVAVTPSKHVIVQNVTKAPTADPSKGITTESIYEPGHMNEEINVERLCPNQGEDLKLLILITSAQPHLDARMAIRQTWGHYGTRRDVATAFVLGRSSNDSLNVALSQENFIYGDLIRGHFIDSYNNLTLKTISALEWVDHHCNRAKYILKTDDDMFINVPKLLSFLEMHLKEKKVIFGRLAKKWKPIRNIKSKYYVSNDQFSATIFPPFTTGPAYVMSNDIVHDLYVNSLRQVYLKLEDVFTTGIVAQQLGIKRVHGNEFLNRRIALNPCNIRKTISVHMIKANEQFDLWKKLLDQTIKCK